MERSFDLPDFSYEVVEVRPSGWVVVEVTLAPARGYRRKGDVALLWLRGLSA